MASMYTYQIMGHDEPGAYPKKQWIKCQSIAWWLKYNKLKQQAHCSVPPLAIKLQYWERAIPIC